MSFTGFFVLLMLAGPWIFRNWDKQDWPEAPDWAGDEFYRD